jgi:hypothetical protein
MRRWNSLPGDDAVAVGRTAAAVLAVVTRSYLDVRHSLAEAQAAPLHQSDQETYSSGVQQRDGPPATPRDL